MSAYLDELVWLLLLLGPLLFLQRSLQRQIQAVFLLATRRAEIALALFSLLLLPGVFLHELSHFLVAHLLGVRTGRFSLLPRPMPDGRLRLGYVEVSASDPLRDSLIGAAPLLAGGAFVTYAGLQRLGLHLLYAAWLEAGLRGAWAALPGLAERPDFWLWFYLAIAVSSSMLPSASDRRAWLTILLAVGILLGLGLLAGAGPWLLANLAPPLSRALQAVLVVLAISLFLHLLLLPPFWLAHRLLSRLTGLEVS